MRKFGVILLVFVLCMNICFVHAAAQTTSGTGCTSLQAGLALSEEEAFSGTAEAAILFEMDSQTLVYAKNPDTIINPTGLVKILTGLIVLEEGNLDDVVTVQRSTLNSVSAGAVSAKLKAGEQMTVRDLLYCVMVSSANDAAAVLAEHVAGSQAEFVKKMNERAATLGCVNTHFSNVHGLQDSQQYSTARELAIITEEALKNPDFVSFFGVSNCQLPATNLSDARSLSTTNYLMDPSSKYYDARVTGGKPAAATTADRSVICTAENENGRYLCVIISATAKTSGYSVTQYTNFTEAKKLLDLGFQGYALQQVLGSREPFALYTVTGGENGVVVGPDEDVYALLPVNFDAEMLHLRTTENETNLIAPVAEGTAVGTLQIYYGSVMVAQVELLARHDVAVKGTTIQSVEKKTGGSSLWKILKWCALGLMLLVAVAAGALLALRQVNKTRHKKKMRQRRPAREEN